MFRFVDVFGELDPGLTVAAGVAVGAPWGAFDGMAVGLAIAPGVAVGIIVGVAVALRPAQPMVRNAAPVSSIRSIAKTFLFMCTPQKIRGNRSYP